MNNPIAILNYEEFVDPRDRLFKVARRDNPAVEKSFRYSDDRWFLLNLLTSLERAGDGTIVFSGLPKWLQEDARRYVAHLWLEKRERMNLIQQTMVSLRHLGTLLSNYDGRPIDLQMRHAKEFVRRFCELGLGPVSVQGARRRINRFISFVRQQHPSEAKNNFKLYFPKKYTLLPQHEPYKVPESAIVSTDRLGLIIDACASDLNVYRQAKDTYINQDVNRNEYNKWWRRERQGRLKQGSSPGLGWTTRFKELHSRAIKAQAIILAICVGRRAAAICNTAYDVKVTRMEWTNESGQPEKGVMVRFRELKIRNVDEDVPCPDAFGELAENAIKTAKELTSELRGLNPVWKDYLFLVPKSKKIAVVLSQRQLNQYLNGQHGNNMGLLSRYNIPGGKINIHSFRKTRATNAWRGGFSGNEVAQDLGQVNSDMARRFYIAGGEEAMHRFKSLMQRGSLSGALIELVNGQEIVNIRLTRRHVEILHRQGLQLRPTRYGYCALLTDSGLCTVTNLCYVGPGEKGGGCDYHLLSPDALPALYEDKDVIEAIISLNANDPAVRTWLVNQQNQLKLVESKIVEALTLQHNYEGRCDSQGQCRCDATT